MEKSNILSMKVTRSKNDQKITIDYFVQELNRNRIEEITEIPHQDFNKALLNLSPYLAHIFHSDSEDYVATGFKFASNNKVIITGKLSTEDGSIVGIATPSIDLDDAIYEMEDDLNKDLDTLLEETMEFLLGRKVGVKQLTIEDSIKQNEQDEEELQDTDISEETEMDDNPDNDEFILPE